MGGPVQGPDPERHQDKYIFSKTRKDAATKLARAIADRDSGVVFECGALTVEDYLGKWLDSVKGTVRERTRKRSEEVVRLHLTRLSRES